MSELVMDTLLIVVMLIVLNWRESRSARQSLSPVRRRVLTMGRRPMPCDASREILEGMHRKAS